jgi:hypothetical protein
VARVVVALYSENRELFTILFAARARAFCKPLHPSMIVVFALLVAVVAATPDASVCEIAF